MSLLLREVTVTKTISVRDWGAEGDAWEGGIVVLN